MNFKKSKLITKEKIIIKLLHYAIRNNHIKTHLFGKLEMNKKREKVSERERKRKKWKMFENKGKLSKWTQKVWG